SEWALQNIVLDASFRLDPKLLDERPPFLDLGLLECAERLRRLLLARENLIPEIGIPRSHQRIGQCLSGGGVEPVDYLLRRAFWREKPVPTGTGERKRQSHLAKGRDVRRLRQARVTRHRIGPYAPGPHQ